MRLTGGREAGSAGEMSRLLFAWALAFFTVAVLCWPQFCHAKAEEGGETDAEIAGPAITTVPLHQASGDGNLEQVKQLLSKGTDVNARDVLGSTALMFAGLSGNVEICKLLVDHKADINAKNKDGVTALMFASAEGFLPVVEFLVDKGAEINVADNGGKSALSYAKAEGREQVEKFLVAKGGKEPPDLETMHWSDHRRCIRVPICIRWGYGHCREWIYEVRCRRRHFHHPFPPPGPPPPGPPPPPPWR